MVRAQDVTRFVEPHWVNFHLLPEDVDQSPPWSPSIPNDTIPCGDAGFEAVAPSMSGRRDHMRPRQVGCPAARPAYGRVEGPVLLHYRRRRARHPEANMRVSAGPSTAAGVLQGDGDDVGSVVVAWARVSAFYGRADPDGEVLALAGGPGLRVAQGGEQRAELVDGGLSSRLRAPGAWPQRRKRTLHRVASWVELGCAVTLAAS
ncbi:hypothetical protein [Streptomyces europaeiscabiei]|uniref:hypothetical protein n=1 Tax=Streptomyces europaeiscabiei TaxID=146819 RepID=UPI00131DE168|nr:hypothetical protein [Streptomyces europaeiscabiei]MDX3848711.1 hypothetical protein [Streptomyces europaeiscabiei]